MPRPKNDFRAKSQQLDIGELLQPKVWYRSPLSNYDHLLGEDRDWANDELAWCGFALGIARDLADTGDKQALGGLWPSVRNGGKCAYCRGRQETWDATVGANYGQQ